jgi:uncharacterized phage-associated protein
MPEQLTCFDVADYFLSLVNKESGDSISNFKLQKLVYYAQGFHLALFGKSLFNESIEAGQNGPTIPALFDKYKVYENKPINSPETIDSLKYSESTKELLETIFREYGQLSPGKLREMIYGEIPWINGFKKENKIVSNDDLKKYFMTQIQDGKIKKRV